MRIKEVAWARGLWDHADTINRLLPLRLFQSATLRVTMNPSATAFLVTKEPKVITDALGMQIVRNGSNGRCGWPGGFMVSDGLVQLPRQHLGISIDLPEPHEAHHPGSEAIYRG